MGREQDLINAAKNGNVAHIEKLLGQRSKKPSLHSIMGRSVNPNFQDEMGYTSLHYASLHGHRSAVELLLKYDASTNIPDYSGNYPLHLAAFNGHAEVARILINTGPSRANVSEQNGTEDTALHSAAQFGYNQVVAVFLENHADPFIRNCRKESPLDLAAQYGRIETVKLLLNYHPNLLQNLVKTHTPLHLASRNGHISVVSNLLGGGMSVNTECDTGTALHEAALFGKIDVCNLLLQCDVDIKVKDKNHMTVMDLLMNHPSAKSKEISILIYRLYSKGIEFAPDDHSQGKRSRNPSSSSSSLSVNQDKANFMPARSSTMVYRHSNYDDVPDPRPLSGFKRCDTYDSVPAQRSPNNMSQFNYDYVPNPHPAAEEKPASYAGVSQRLAANSSVKPILQPCKEEGYALLMAANPPTSATTSILTPQNVTDGYTMLGVPSLQSKFTSASPPKTRVPQNSMEEYSTVRYDGDAEHRHGVGSPPQNPVGDVSKSSFYAGEGTEPLPSEEMISKENVAYFHIGAPGMAAQPQSQTLLHPPTSQTSTGDDYEVAPVAKPTHSFPMHHPLYEIPPPKRQLAEGEYGLLGAVIANQPSRTQRQQKISLDLGGGTYDVVSFPPRDAESEGNPQPVSPPVYEIPPPFKSREGEFGSDCIASSGKVQHKAASKPCPLDIPQYEIVTLRDTPSPSQMGPETQAMAPLAGYEPMVPMTSPAHDERFGEYEILAPFHSHDGEYENVTLPETSSDRDVFLEHTTGISFAESQSGSQHGVVQPPTQTQQIGSPPVYEIVPLPKRIPEEPRSVSPYSSSQTPPVYEIAPPPRPMPRPPLRIPKESAHQGSLIKKDEPPVPPSKQRPINQYQESPIKQNVQPTNKGLPAPYEVVRIEAPQGKINLDQIRQQPVMTSAGEYCTLDPMALGITAPPPIPPRDDLSVSSSDLPDTPGFPPPSPSTAQAAVFEAFKPGLSSPIKTIPEHPGDEVAAVDSMERPVPAPRGESLKDKMVYSHDELKLIVQASSPLASNGLQDPFSFPPSNEKEKETNTIAMGRDHDLDNNLASKRNEFASLHKRYSPYGSREDLTEDHEAEKAKKVQEEAQSTAVSSSALLYENVLFERSDSMTRGSIGHKPTAKSEEDQAEVVTYKEEKKDTQQTMDYRLSALDANSPLDETAEWEKIEALLLSIGEIEIPETLEDQIADAGKAKTVPDWLKVLGVGQYESDLMACGFDDLGFLNGGILDDQDLLEIGVKDLSHRKIILEAIKSLPVPPRISDSSTESSSACDWLESLKLPEYMKVFEHNGYSTMDRIKMIWEVELTSVLEINSLGHRKRILASLATPRRMTLARKREEKALFEAEGNFGLEDKLAELNIYCPDEEAPEVSEETTVSVDTDVLMTLAEETLQSEVLKKKAKQRKKEKHWRHDPEVLLKGSVNYTTQYLGSHMVRDITGISSTIDACRKMRMSTAKLQKVPSVMLSISVNGIKFIDARSKLLVSYHDMRNVSYITQDPEDKRVFAYIAKDAKIDKHYCHVFRVDNKPLSDDVTMSIGQAFELAFEQFVQIQQHLVQTQQQTHS